MNRQKHTRLSHLAIGILVATAVLFGALTAAMLGPARSEDEKRASTAMAGLAIEKNFAGMADITLAAEDGTAYGFSILGNFAIPAWSANGQAVFTIKPPFAEKGSSGNFKFFIAGEDFFGSLVDTTVRPQLPDSFKTLAQIFVGRWYHLPADLAPAPSTRQLEKSEKQIRDALIIHSRKSTPQENGDLEIEGALDATLFAEILRERLGLSIAKATEIQTSLREKENKIQIVISPKNKIRRLEMNVNIPLPQLGETKISASADFSAFGNSPPKIESPRGSVLFDPRLFFAD